MRITGSDSDDVIDRSIRMAAALIEGPDGIGIALNSQQWDLYRDEFAFEMEIPIRPLVSIDSITYTDSDGNAGQTVASSVYELDVRRGLVRSLSGQSWPSTDTVYDAVRIRVNAGYSTLPGDLEGCVLLLAAHFFENTEAAIDSRLVEIPMGAQQIMERYRRGRFA